MPGRCQHCTHTNQGHILFPKGQFDIGRYFGFYVGFFTGFLQAHHQYVRPLAREDQDRAATAVANGAAVAYQAAARLTVRLAQPERAGQVAAAAVAAGGHDARVHGLGLAAGDPVEVAAAAREAAWRDALARAGQYAELAGMALGPVLEIREAPPPPPDARPMRLLAAEAGPPGPATEPGETTVWAAVSVTWALRRPPTAT